MTPEQSEALAWAENPKTINWDYIKIVAALCRELMAEKAAAESERDALAKAVAFYTEHWDCDYETRRYHGCYVGPDEEGGHPINWLRRAAKLPAPAKEAK